MNLFLSSESPSRVIGTAIPEAVYGRIHSPEPSPATSRQHSMRISTRRLTGVGWRQDERQRRQAAKLALQVGDERAAVLPVCLLDYYACSALCVDVWRGV